MVMITIANVTNERFPTFLINFQRGAINTIQAIFANPNVKGCFFRLCSNVWKHVQNVGLQVRYVEEPEFALRLRMLTALTPNVAVCIEIGTNFGNVADKLLAYFEDTYVIRFRHNAPRNNPTFSIELWNMFYGTDDELPRTNNSVEG